MEIPRDHGDESVDEQVGAPPADEVVGDEVEPQLAESATRTGVESVDRVLDSLDGLGDLPVEEHVAVFEQAHERLRGALDAPASPSIPAVLRPDA